METETKTTEQMEEEVKTALVVIEPESRSLVQTANELIVVDDASLSRSVDVEKELKAEKKKFTDLFKDFKGALKSRHSNACAKEKEMIEPVKTAIDELQTKRNTYLEAERERARKEQEAREAEERRIRAAKLAKYNESVKKAMEKGGDLAVQRDIINKELESPDTPEEAVEGLRGQLRTIDAQIENQNRLISEKAAQAEEVATAPAPPPPAAVAPKPTGLVEKEYYTVMVKEPRTLCQAIADGHIGPNIIKGFDTVALQNLAKNGIDLEKYGCQVDVETRTHTRG